MDMSQKKETWLERYADPARMDLDRGQKSWDREVLFSPSQVQKQHHAFPLDQQQAMVRDAFESHIERRRAEVRQSTGPDRERATLMFQTELKGMEAYELKGQSNDPKSLMAREARLAGAEHRQALGRLVEYDTEHNHPVTRGEHKTTLDERRSWAERDGRQMTSSELTSYGAQGGHDLFRHGREPVPTHEPREGSKEPRILTGFAAARAAQEQQRVGQDQQTHGQGQGQNQGQSQNQSIQPPQAGSFAAALAKRNAERAQQGMTQPQPAQAKAREREPERGMSW